jgi:steroid 5-alpha reductase family enzyme
VGLVLLSVLWDIRWNGAHSNSNMHYIDEFWSIFMIAFSVQLT